MFTHSEARRSKPRPVSSFSAVSQTRVGRALPQRKSPPGFSTRRISLKISFSSGPAQQQQQQRRRRRRKQRPRSCQRTLQPQACTCKHETSQRVPAPIWMSAMCVSEMMTKSTDPSAIVSPFSSLTLLPLLPTPPGSCRQYRPGFSALPWIFRHLSAGQRQPSRAATGEAAGSRALRSASGSSRCGSAGWVVRAHVSMAAFCMSIAT
jgi:hypothetical protein